MYRSRIKNRYVRFSKQRLCQGDIFRDLVFTIRIKNGGEEDKIELPYAVIMSQDCDVDIDFQKRKQEKEFLKSFNLEEHSDKFRSLHDKLLPTILVCPAYRLDDFIAGSHIAGRFMQTKLQKEIEKIKNNSENRYYYLPQDSEIGITELIIDFKHFFTIPTDVIYKQRKESYLASISELFRENLSQKFANYLSRFGLPF